MKTKGDRLNWENIKDVKKLTINDLDKALKSSVTIKVKTKGLIVP